MFAIVQNNEIVKTGGSIRTLSRCLVDPITILAACTAVWNGIKKASEFAQEAEGVWSQLSKYAGLADQLEQHITTAKNKPQKPKLSVN
jgi:hypothetical protein